MTAVVAMIVQLLLSAAPSDAQGPRVRRSPGRRIAVGTILTETAKLMPGDAGDRYTFGEGIAISDDGETLVIGSDCAETQGLWCAGSAYVYTWSDGEWIYHQTVSAAEPQRQDYFGFPTILGDTLFIGARANNAGGYSQAGVVYVFTRPPGEDTYWIQHQTLTASTLDHWDQFGVSTAASDDTLVVGARAVGTAHVFNRTDGGDWVVQQVLTLPHTGGTALAESVAIDGDTIMVGAIQAAHSESTEAGAVFVFTRSGTVWIERQMLIAPDPADGDFFGWSINVVGDTAVIGANWDDLEDFGDENPRDYLNAGSLHIFERTDGTWDYQQTITARDPIDGEHFGSSAVLAGSVLLVGAESYVDAGAVYAFTRSGDEWVQRQRISASDGSPADGFGQNLCIHGDTVVVGAPSHDHSDLTDAGAVYVYRLRPLINVP